MKRARIVGTGSYLPHKVLTNADLEQLVDTSDAWIQARTGIQQRRVAAPEETTSSLAVKAAQGALDAAGWQPQEVDAVVVATITGDYPWPATSCLVQQELGLGYVPAWDVSAACSGFVYALHEVAAGLETGRYQRVLVIGAEVLSRIIDWTDRNTCVLFGDGAGAAALEAQESECGIISGHLHSDGSQFALLGQRGFGSAAPASSAGLEQRLPFLHMEGNEVFKVAVRSLTEVAEEALHANGLTPADLSLLIPHQANRRILEAVFKRLGLDSTQTYVNVDQCGNTSAASIPIALDEVARAGRLQAGDWLLLDAFGGGFTWGAVLIRW